VTAGSDPHDDCADETTTNVCGRDGACDGAGACREAPRGRLCAQAACVDAHTFASAGTCDGAGLCVAGARVDCGAYSCGADGCAKPCVDDASCPAGSTCASGVCQVRRENGQVCAANSACASGFCSPDQICCDQACVGTCLSCAANATGQPDGTCAAVRQGLDPRDDCPTDAPESCGRNGACDGAGRCELYGAGTVCEPARCDPDGQFVSARTCGGGACAPAVAEACHLAVCDPDSGCKHECGGDGDCVEQSYCDAASQTCAAQKANGASCAADHECLSVHCADGVCCDSACTGRCVSCLAIENGQQADGSCGDVVDGTDPESECAADAAACGLDGFCGQGRCRLAPATTACAPAVCVNAPGNTSATFTPAAQCDGQGACVAATPRLCPGSVICLSEEECRPGVCAGDGDCLSGFYCAAGTCSAQQPVGGTCAADDQCTNGLCAETSHGDAVCCSTSCPLACEGCALSSTGLPTGTCAPRLANATAVCGGACAVGYGLCSSGLSCQPTAWTFDGEPTDASLPYGWEPDDMSGLFYSPQQNHTPGGIGSLGVIAGTPWDATPNIVLCQKDPDIVDPTSMSIGGKTLDAWILIDGPPTTGTCLFSILHPDGTAEEIRGLQLNPEDVDVWRELTVTVPLTNPDVVKLGIRCLLEDGWPGTLYIDDVSIR
jgi:hypothetical protein